MDSLKSECLEHHSNDGAGMTINTEKIICKTV